MARPPTAEGDTAGRTPAATLADSSVPWLEAPRRQFATARRDGRLPHAILVHGVAGSGQSALSLWAAQLILCQEASDEPCGHCGSCVLFRVGNHPDFHWIEIEEKASYIKVDQVRELCARLETKSYRGGWKVGLIDPADQMNISSNNALLKTLEEPPENTVLILAAARTDRLAPTLVSRCQRLRIPAPAPSEALRWLQEQGAREDWPELLALAGGAPLRAVELAQSGAGELLSEIVAALPTARSQTFDPLQLAEAWSRDRPADRLACLEFWLESRVRQQAAVSDAVNNNRDNALPSPAARLNIRIAFRLLDRVREARARQPGPLNTLLLFEELLVDVADAFAGGIAARPENQG
jgi:DNA polymerase-3 subunit delta'